MTDAHRRVLLVTHTGRDDIADSVAAIAESLRRVGFDVYALADEITELGLSTMAAVDPDTVGDLEVVIAIGGDGTFLRAAEVARPHRVPLLGVNLGRVGFLAEAELSDIDMIAERLAGRDYDVDERLTVDATVRQGGHVIAASWALNEATVEKGQPARMLEVLIEIDDRKLSRYGCDGVVCATPSGSTAHAMSAGGPVVWPTVDALLVVPISAHALFSRPLVVAPTSTIAVTIEPYAPAAVLTCDGRRTYEVPPGATVVLRRGIEPVRVVRFMERPFPDRLVAKLGLPVNGWRGHRIS